MLVFDPEKLEPEARRLYDAWSQQSGDFDAERAAFLGDVERRVVVLREGFPDQARLLVEMRAQATARAVDAQKEGDATVPPSKFAALVVGIARQVLAA